VRKIGCGGVVGCVGVVEGVVVGRVVVGAVVDAPDPLLVLPVEVPPPLPWASAGCRLKPVTKNPLTQTRADRDILPSLTAAHYPIDNKATIVNNRALLGNPRPLVQWRAGD
jgi:hypothetical protein